MEGRTQRDQSKWSTVASRPPVKRFLLFRQLVQLEAHRSRVLYICPVSIWAAQETVSKDRSDLAHAEAEDAEIRSMENAKVANKLATEHWARESGVKTWP